VLLRGTNIDALDVLVLTASSSTGGSSAGPSMSPTAACTCLSASPAGTRRKRCAAARHSRNRPGAQHPLDTGADAQQVWLLTRRQRGTELVVWATANSPPTSGFHARQADVGAGR
jgi:hypothetical protein